MCVAVCSCSKKSSHLFSLILLFVLLLLFTFVHSLTPNQHHNDGENFFSRSIRRNITKANGSQTGECVVQCCYISFHIRNFRNIVVFQAFSQCMHPTCYTQTKESVRRKHLFFLCVKYQESLTHGKQCKFFELKMKNRAKKYRYRAM